MPRVPMVNDDEYGAAFADALMEILAGSVIEGLPAAEDEGPPEVNTAETYGEAMMMTRDPGVVAYMSDGAEVRLTIQAYRPDPGRRDY